MAGGDLEEGRSALDEAAVKRFLDLLPNLLGQIEDKRTVFT
mgnify:CR=1 FL=1